MGAFVSEPLHGHLRLRDDTRLRHQVSRVRGQVRGLYGGIRAAPGRQGLPRLLQRSDGVSADDETGAEFELVGKVGGE